MQKNARISIFSDIVKEAHAYFRVAQNSDKGFPYNDTGSPSGAWSSSGVIWALASISEDGIDDFVKEALDYVIFNQNPNGLIPVTSKGDQGCIDATSQFIISVAMVDPELRSYSNSFRKAVAALLNSSVNYTWGTLEHARSVVSSTSLALYALQHVYIIDPDPDVKNAILAGVSWLMNIRNPDNGWGIYEGNASKTATTAFALSAIGTCLPDELDCKTKIVGDAHEFLFLKQNKDGSWPDVIEREAGLTVIRVSTPYCISSLVTTGCNINDLRCQKGIAFLLKQFKQGQITYQDSDIVTWSTRDGLLALSAIRHSVTQHQLHQLLDQNTQLDEQRMKAEMERKSLSRAFELYKKDERMRIDAQVNLEIVRVKTSCSFLRALTSISTLLFFTISFLAFIPKTLSVELRVSVASIMVAVWAVLVAALYAGG